MSIFRKHKSIVDRSAADRSRHKKKIDKAIKESIKDVIAEESIIGQNGKKKIRIPVRGIKEYRFVYGNNENNKTVGSGGDHNVKRGYKIGQKRADEGSGQGPGGPSDQKGDEYYDVEVSLEELADYLFNDLELPDLEKKKFKFVSQESIKRQGYRFKGIRPRLSKKETLKRKIRRQKMAEKVGTYDPESDERYPFHEDDLKYHHIKPKIKENSAAVIFFLMDVSGSMSMDRKYLARSFFFLLYQFLNHKYEKIDVVFISHATEAKRVSEDDFFKVGTSGGTLISTCLDLELEIISKEYHPNTWNIYSFYCGDGENWSSDNEKCIGLFKEIKEISQLTGYCEINEHYANFAEEEEDIIMPSGYPWPSFSAWKNEEMENLWFKLTALCDEKFKKVMIGTTEHIWKAFNQLFGGGK
ncbi:MAG: sporulation protein YhbH [Parcubacteria group bacterium]|nr:sporulation protein YhbH [Parcubacteria group bacterium]|tara:strand:+ start:2661 stop:3899 length:1239 start_codon:yes stop_codon:yes gene_type:complete